MKRRTAAPDGVSPADFRTPRTYFPMEGQERMVPVFVPYIEEGRIKSDVVFFPYTEVVAARAANAVDKSVRSYPVRVSQA